jgi:predicted ATPase
MEIELSNKTEAEILEIPLVERENELKTLLQLLSQIQKENRFHGIIIYGESGIGKSRLLAEYTKRLELEDIILFKAEARPHMKEIPYSIFSEILTEKAKLKGNESYEETLSKLRILFSSIGTYPKIEDDIKSIGFLAGFISPLPSLHSFESSRMSRRGIRALMTYYQRLASSSPIVLLIDDLHFIDASSLKLLEDLFVKLQRRPLLFIGTARKELFYKKIKNEEIQELYLKPLSSKAISVIFSYIVKQEPPLELKKFILEHSKGNPYMIEEIIKSLLEWGALVKKEGKLYFSSNLLDLELLKEAENILLSRVEHLSQEEKALLEYAAVIGSVFWEEPLKIMKGKEVKSSLLKLQKQGFIFSRSFSRARREYMFKHGLLQNAVYRTIPKERRKRYHLQVASWLKERQLLGKDTDFLIAYHSELGGNQKEAAYYYIKAGIKAGEDFANDQALKHYTRSLELCNRDEELQFQALIGREEIWNRIGNREEQLKDILALIKIGNKYSNRVSLGEALLRQGKYLFDTAQYEKSRLILLNAVQRKRREKDLEGEVRALISLGATYRELGRYLKALQILERANLLAAHTLQWELKRSTLSILGTVRLCLGDFKSALRDLNESLKIEQALGQSKEEGYILTNIGWSKVKLGEYEEAIELLENAQELNSKIGDKLQEGYTLRYLGNAYLGIGKLREAAESELWALAIAEKTSNMKLLAGCKLELCRIYTEYKEKRALIQAIKCASECIEIAKKWRLKDLEAQGLSLRAKAKLMLKKFQKAERDSLLALEIMEELESGSEFFAEILWIHSLVLQGKKEEHRSRRYLFLAQKEVSTMAGYIQNLKIRKNFLTKVKLNREIMDAWDLLQKDSLLE